MNENSNKKQHKGGRNPKSDPSIHRHVFRLTDDENAQLLTLFEVSGMTNKAKFIIIDVLHYKYMGKISIRQILRHDVKYSKILAQE